MKLKDVKVGEEYEYLRSYDKLPIRSKVTKIGVPLRYYSFGGVELLIESPNGGSNCL